MAILENGSVRSSVIPQVSGGNVGSFQQGVSFRGEQDGRGCAVSRGRCASGARQRLLRCPAGGGGAHCSFGPVPGLLEVGRTRSQHLPTEPGERPLGSRRVVVRLRVRRYFCDRRSCSCRTFVEQVGGLTERHRRSGIGLTGWLRLIAVELGSRPAAQVSARHPQMAAALQADGSGGGLRTGCRDFSGRRLTAWLRPVGVPRGTRAPSRSTHPPVVADCRRLRRQPGHVDWRYDRASVLTHLKQDHREVSVGPRNEAVEGETGNRVPCPHSG